MNASDELRADAMRLLERTHGIRATELERIIANYERRQRAQLASIDQRMAGYRARANAYIERGWDDPRLPLWKTAPALSEPPRPPREPSEWPGRLRRAGIAVAGLVALWVASMIIFYILKVMLG